MVTDEDLAQLSWEEAFTPIEAAQKAKEIIAALTRRLTSSGPEHHRLYFAVPNPTPYAAAEAEFAKAMINEGASPENSRILTLPGGGKCYAFADASLFTKVLPDAFRLGPPELTLIAMNSDLHLGATEDALVELVLKVLGSRTTAQTGSAVGMHFDSGDLMQVFYASP